MDPLPLVEMRSISKSFGALQALRDVDLVLQPREILGLVGDNSAGKSTLMKILTGAYHPDSGSLRLEGREVQFHTPHDSRDEGIEMVYQDFALCGNLDIASNIYLGRWPTRGLFIDRKKMERDSLAVLKRMNVEVTSPTIRVENLSGGRQQAVAIARAVSFNPKVLILDEPTANLSFAASERFLRLAMDLKADGVSIIIISHRIEEVFEIGDRVMVLSRGRKVGERRIPDTNRSDVLSMIVHGSEVEGDI